jgi:hypothetical protein
MGQHFVPQAYLRAFECSDEPGSVWIQSRRAASPRLAAISKVAQAHDFYGAEMEALLASAIEAPANPVLARLRQGQVIEARQYPALIVYIATMIRRVPRQRSRALELAQPTLDTVITRIRRQIGDLASAGRLSPDLARQRLQEVSEVHEQYTQSLPKELLAQLHNPLPTAAIIEALWRMRWRVLMAPDSDYFIASDNPAFYHEAYGIGTDKAELRLPLSPRVALHGTQAGPSEAAVFSIHPVGRDWVREFNRSVASGATSIAISHRRSVFLKTLLCRKKPYLFRLIWNSAGTAP